jgi:hypothetical protein
MMINQFVLSLKRMRDEDGVFFLSPSTSSERRTILIANDPHGDVLIMI